MGNRVRARHICSLVHFFGSTAALCRVNNDNTTVLCRNTVQSRLCEGVAQSAGEQKLKALC